MDRLILVSTAARSDDPARQILNRKHFQQTSSAEAHKVEEDSWEKNFHPLTCSTYIQKPIRVSWKERWWRKNYPGIFHNIQDTCITCKSPGAPRNFGWKLSRESMWHLCQHCPLVFNFSSLLFSCCVMFISGNLYGYLYTAGSSMHDMKASCDVLAGGVTRSSEK